MHFHKYKPIKEIRKSNFLGTEVQDLVATDFKICTVCHKVKEYFYDSQGGCWSKLDTQRTKILLSKLQFSDEIILERDEKRPVPSMVSPPTSE